jgi:hypothetical protein
MPVATTCVQEDTRSMRISAANIGLVLAVVAGVVAISQAIRPGGPPQAESLNFWLPLTIVAGAVFLLGAVLADRYTTIAKALLIGAGTLLIISGIYFGAVAGGGERSAVALVADLAPGLLGVAAGVLIGPVRRSAAP